jgi:hypothetical protein
MTCGPLSKDQILDLYTDIKIEIDDRIKNPSLGVFDIDSYMKDLYNDLVDVDDPNSNSRALIYVQQVPGLLEKLISNERDIKAHFFKYDSSVINKISKLAFDFTDPSAGLNAVARYVKKSKIKPEYINAAIKNMSSTKGALPVVMYDNEKGAELLKWSSNNKRQKPLSALVTTGQEYVPVDPKNISEADRNALKDPSKILFYSVVSEVVKAAKSKLNDNDAPSYRGTPVALRAIPSKSIPENQLTDEVKEKLKSNPYDKKSGKTFRLLHNEGVSLVLVDADTNEFLYFDELGNIVDENEPNGRLVYQPMRKVQKTDEGKLALSNNADYTYTLVSPKEIATARQKIAEATGVTFTKKDFDNIVAYETARINKEVNTIYDLRNYVLKNPEAIVTLPIDNGSFGYVGSEAASGVPLSQTSFKATDIKELYVETIEDGGLTYFFANNGETKVYLQRSNMPQEVIDKIADVLTTTATLPNGKQLTPDERVQYVRTFLGPTPVLKGYKVTPIKINSEIVDGTSVVSILINDVPVDPTEEGAKEFIAEALKTQIKGTKSDNIFSAPLNYSKESLNQTYVDYEIENGKIKEVELNYFDAIAPHIRIIYDKESSEFVKGSNAYLAFSVTEDVEELITPKEAKAETPITKTIKKAEEKELDLEDINDDTLQKTFGNITINENSRSGYASAQEEGVKKASAVISFSENFDSPTQQVLQKQVDENKKEYSGQPIQKRNNAYQVSEASLANNLVNTVNNSDGTLYISGDSLPEMKTSSQKTVDNFMFETLRRITEHPNLQVDITKVITNGQSGISEAVAKAADRLGIPVEIIAPKGFMYRVKYTSKKTKKADIKDISNERSFKTRFGLKTSKAKAVKQELSIEEIAKYSITPLDGIDAKAKTEKLINDINKDIDSLERSKAVRRFVDSIFVTKGDQKKALDWYNNESGLKNVISLERITAIVNSNAFAQWNINGITLFEGDGGTNVDIYHEAWHGFSQLYLTLDEKTKLYEEVGKRPKWQKKTYDNKLDLFRDIEEEIAEDFRSYMIFKKKFPGIMGRIFESIAKALRAFFSKVTKRDFLKPRDIAAVRKQFDILYKGEVLNLLPSQDNVLFKQENLFRAKENTPQLVKTDVAEFLPFTSEETEKVKIAMDNIMASVFMKYNDQKNTSAGVAKILQNTNNRKGVYKIIRNTLELKATELFDAVEEYQKTVIENVSAEKPDYEKEKLLQEQVDKYQLLQKVLANFGDIDQSVEGKQKSGIVAFHMNNTRFNIIKNTYLEMSEDPSAAGESMKMAEATQGNIRSSKEIANEDTWMVISSIFKPEVDEKGNYVTRKNEDGVESVVYEKDFFGFDALQSQDVMWNKLARTLQGSLTPLDIWNKLKEFEENYPEFQQLQKLLPNPGQEYTDNKEFSTETKFWQDFKKPRIPYLQLSINKSKDAKGSIFKSLVGDVTFDIYKVFLTWDFNFKTFEKDTNRFISDKDRLSRNVLDTELLISEFSDKNGKFDDTKSLDFLYALGIILDTSSAEIRAITKKRSFAGNYGLDIMFEAIKLVEKASKSTDEKKINAALEFKLNPLTTLSEGLSEDIGATKMSNYEVSGRLKILAELQNRYSNEFSNFSVQSPEKNRVWEHFLDSTLTRQILAINEVDDFRILSEDAFDIKKEFKHMRWMSDANNPHIKNSVILNSIFFLDKYKPDTYGKKRKIKTEIEGEDSNSIIIKNIAGTQIIDTDTNYSDGINTSSADATTKFLQEMNTVLMYGIQEFMRHASKQMAQGIRAEKVLTYPGKKQSYLYVDIEDFKPAKQGKGQDKAFDIVLNYISGEHERIQRFNADIDKFSKWKGYNRKVRKKDGSIVMAGQVFTAFDDVLTEDTKEQLYAIKEDLKLAAESNSDLYNLIKKDVDNYFRNVSNDNAKLLQESRYVDPALYDMATEPNMTQGQTDKVLATAYTYNSWIHNYETIILAYGDLAQYDHAKEEFHKRNAGLTSPGKGFRADERSRQFIQNQLNYEYAKKNGYEMRSYDGTLHTAIMREKKLDSIYAAEYREALIEDYLKRFKNNKSMSAKEKKAKAAELADTALGEYFGMKEGDGQGHITLESYRMLKNLEGNWSDLQEKLYLDIVNGKELSISDVVEYFPPYKLQYFGNIQTTGLSLVSFHKFSLAPLIPSVTGTSKLSALHDKMMNEQIDYAVYDTGSKIGHLNSSSDPKEFGDMIFDKSGNLIPDTKFTKNIIFTEYLKNQTEINKSYKEKSIFSTQMRKLVLEGLYEQGVIQSTDEDKITNKVVLDYLKHVDEYSTVLKDELLNEIGYKKEIENGKEVFKPIDETSTAKLLGLIESQLADDDSLGEHLLSQFIGVYKNTGELVHDLSLHPEASKIEKLVLSLVNKRLIKQKVNGESLVQVSASMYEGIFGSPLSGLTKATDSDIKKWVGSNFLPTYHRKADGKTAAMKVMIALQGSYENLLKLKDLDGKPIGNITRLNEMIKNDEWLDKDDNRKSVTIVGVRIPVQGLNSMEFMEVYQFLPPEAGNIIVPPSEIVAKSGADFDIDKLTVYMPNINSKGEYTSRSYTQEEFNKKLSETEQKDKSSLFKNQKAALENELISDLRNILELPQNYASLITPNGTYLLKDIADKLSTDVADFSIHKNYSSEEINYDEKGKKLISPTRLLELRYNLYKHESNVIGKKTLGLGAVENTFNVLFNSIGAYMPATYLHSDDATERSMDLLLRHNTLTNKDGQEVISLSNRYDVDSMTKIADVFSQAMNGWVDVEKDAWIFFIQGNYEVAPTLLYLVKTGVPVEDAIYFVSHPLIREYVKEQRASNSTFADPLGVSVEQNLIKSAAASRVLKKHFNTTVKSKSVYYERKKLSDSLNNVTFDKNRMEALIKAGKKNDEGGYTNPGILSSDMSKLAFLHFLEIEQQITGIKQLKVNTNPDTSIKTNFSEVEQSEASQENLEFNSKIAQEVREKLRNESVTSSFDNNELALSMIRPLMKLRYHPNLSEWIKVNTEDFKSALKTLPFSEVSTAVDVFRNDFVSFIFQNALKSYAITDSYKSINSSTTIPSKEVTSLKRGAFVKENATGEPTLYLDIPTLRMQFKYKMYDKDSGYENDYEDLSLYPLKSSYFTSFRQTNEAVYFAFVAEREYLRYLLSKSEITKSADYTDAVKDLKGEYPKMPLEKREKLAYEKVLAMRALDNTYNYYKLFKDPEQAFAVKIGNLLNKPYMKKLKLQYEVLQKLTPDTDSKNSIFNIYINEKDYTTSKADLYYKNLKDLANPAVTKVADPIENERISSLFAMLPMVAILQTGFNKTKLNFTNVVDINMFLDLVEDQMPEVMDILNDSEKAGEMLSKFFEMYKRENNSKSTSRNRFKNYYMLNGLSEYAQTEEATSREFMKETSDPNLFIYSQSDNSPKHYKKVVDGNPDVVFVYNVTQAELDDSSKAFKGNSRIEPYAESMSVPFVTSFQTAGDNFISLSSKEYPRVISEIEKSIKEIKDLMKSNIPVAFPSEGFGDVDIMPQQLFVYLSKRLYEEFNYINPGSTQYNEMLTLIEESEGISDRIVDELLLDKDEDPFKCDL